MVRCLENGIISHVITDDGKDGYEIEIPYEDSDVDTSSVEPEDLKKALHAGMIPEAYKEVIQDIKVEEVHRKVVDEKAEVTSIYGTPEEMQKKAKEGYFVRASIWDYKTCNGSHLFPAERNTKSGWGVCALLSRV